MRCELKRHPLHPVVVILLAGFGSRLQALSGHHARQYEIPEIAGVFAIRPHMPAQPSIDHGVRLEHPLATARLAAMTGSTATGVRSANIAANLSPGTKPNTLWL